MRDYIGGKPAIANIDIRVRVTLDLDPGIWTVREDDDNEYAVTGLTGLVDADGVIHFAYPKGVARTATGGWGAKETYLSRALPRNHPNDAWAALPAAVRDLIQDSYLLALDETPEQIGTTA